MLYALRGAAGYHHDYIGNVYLLLVAALIVIVVRSFVPSGHIFFSSYFLYWMNCICVYGSVFYGGAQNENISHFIRFGLFYEKCCLHVITSKCLVHFIVISI